MTKGKEKHELERSLVWMQSKEETWDRMLETSNTYKVPIGLTINFAARKPKKLEYVQKSSPPPNF